jgi:outer membrane protein insertion porin family
MRRSPLCKSGLCGCALDLVRRYLKNGPVGSIVRFRPATYRMMLTVAYFALPLFAGQQSAETDLPTVSNVRKYEGRVIASIQFEPADQPLTDAELKKRLPFQVGSVFTETLLSQAIRGLYATGRYLDLAVDASDQGSQMALKFVTRRAYFVGRVSIKGVKEPPNSGQLVSASKLRLGTSYSDSARHQAVDSLIDLVRLNGFYNAHIDAKTDLHPETSTADVSFDVNTGERARLTDPFITGHPERAYDSIMRSTRWKRLYGLLGWHDVNAARVEQGLDNLRHYYDKRDRLQSQVVLSRLDYLSPDNLVRPSLYMEAGPKIVLAVHGANISRGRLNELVPIYEEKSVDSDLLAEGDRNIAAFLQSEGYFEAAVTHTVEHSGSRDQTVTYEVTHGKRHKFVHLEISGNRYFSLSTLREHFYIEPARFPRFPYGRFSENYLKQDIQSIDDLYSSNGFRDVVVNSHIVDNYRDQQNQISVSVEIKEGPQWLVSSLSIEGVTAEQAQTVRAGLASLPGQPYSPSAIAADRESVLNHYYGLGYLNATFDFYETPGPRPHTMSLRYVVTPGVQRFVRNVLVSGLETTRSHVVYDRIGLQKGHPLSLTEETDSQRRLYDLGIFARVNTSLQNPDGDENDKYVLYDVDEARHYSLNVGVGAQIARLGGGATTLDNPAGSTGFAPRLAVGISRINFLGLGQTLGLQTAVSTIEQRAALTYFIPQFGSRSNLNLTTTALIENSNDIRTYTAYRREASIQLGHRLSRAYTFQYRLVFRNVSLSNLKINRLLVPLLSQPEQLGLAEFSVIQDKRDDPTDAHHGIYTTANFSYAPTFLGSQTSFVRGLFRNSTYHAFHRDFVFARSTQFGIISRLAGVNSIPLAERLYSGGSTSLRSFPDFQAGPRDLETGFVLGGNASFVNNLELRFPLYGDNLGAVLFEDAGNVYSSLGSMSFRFRQRNLQDFNYMVQSAGIGIRYRTPIGPLRVDLSFSPNAPRFFGLKGTLDDLINGTAVSTVQKINAFQFHISLGQAF